MDDDVIILLSDDEESKETAKKVQKDDKTSEEKVSLKRPAEVPILIDDSPEKKIRRIQPTKIGEVSSKEFKDEPSTSSAAVNSVKVEKSSDEPDTAVLDASFESTSTTTNGGTITRAVVRNELSEELMTLIQACRVAEPSDDMKKIIKKKLLKYYHFVHPKYIASRGFLTLLEDTTAEIRRNPHLVYSQLKLVIDELDTRRKAVYLEPLPAPKTEPVTTENGGSSNETGDEKNETKDEQAGTSSQQDDDKVKKTGDKDKDAQLKKLYSTLRKVKRIIEDLETEEVDWDEDEDSSYMKKVRYEKRACEIYEKICEISGESSHAHRLLKKPIVFKGTTFAEFNKRLQKMVNHKQEFPNFRDVLKLLDFCNKKYKYHMTQEHQQIVARDAFTELGKALQERRRADLYETATFYTGKNKDPAKTNNELRVQLEKNKTNYAKIDDIINEFTLKKEIDQNGDDDDDENQTASQDTIEYDPNDSMQLSQVSTDDQPAAENESIAISNAQPVTEEKNTDALNNNDEDDDLIMIS